MFGFCNSGLRLCFFMVGGSRCKNGLDINSRKSSSFVLMVFIMFSMCVIMGNGSCWLNNDMVSDYSVSIVVYSNIDFLCLFYMVVM